MHTRDGWLLNTTAALVLEGLEFHSFGNNNKGKESEWALAVGERAPASDRALPYLGQGRTAGDSDLGLAIGRGQAFGSSAQQHLGSRRCRTRGSSQGRHPELLYCSRAPLGLFEYGKPARGVEAELTNNTFAAASHLWGHHLHNHPVDFGKEDFRSVTIKAVGNVFQSRGRFGVVFAPRLRPTNQTDSTPWPIGIAAISAGKRATTSSRSRRNSLPSRETMVPKGRS